MSKLYEVLGFSVKELQQRSFTKCSVVFDSEGTSPFCPIRKQYP